MRLLGRVPTAEEAVQYFADMAHGRLKKRQRGRGTRRRLTGSWYNGGHGVMKRQPPIKLVTPVAMDIEQAESKLRKIGQMTRKGRKVPKTMEAETVKKRKMTKAPKPKNNTPKKPGYQDNFA